MAPWTNSTAAAQTPEQCHPLARAEQLFQPGRVLIIGELHGTVESAAFIRRVICLALETGLSITLALKFPATDDSRTQAFLNSDGSPEARRTLVSGGHWGSSQQYGLTSAAMLDLLNSVRLWRRDARDI